MELLFTIVSGLIGITLGCWLGWSIRRSKTNQEYTEIAQARASAQDRLDDKAKEVERLSQDLQRLRQIEIDLTEKNATLRASLEAEQKSLEVAKENEQQLRDTFAALSKEALDSNRKTFLAAAEREFGKFHEKTSSDLKNRQEQIGGIVKPIQDKLEQLDQKTHVLNERIDSDTGLTKQIQNLGDVAGDLARALSNPNMTGNWGEIQLRKVIEHSGMLKHCDFDEQETSKKNDDTKQRPDVVVHLTGNRRIVIDSKAPLQAFQKAIEAKSEEDRAEQFKKHADQTKKHMKSLGAKNYWEGSGPAPEYVVMFLPGEGLLSAAYEHSNELFEFGAKTNVFLASPLTLLAMLRAAALGWQEATMTKNIQEVQKLGGELYERTRKVIDHLDNLQRNLMKTVDAFNEVTRSFETRLFVSTRKFKDLGVTNQETLQEISPIDHYPRLLAKSPPSKSLKQDGNTPNNKKRQTES
tara:strand:+ start:9819 stop:11219 length:1401 start_codon:yes stop_codon:yes gene_type:complete